MRTAYLICFTLLLFEMAVAQNRDTIPAKHLSHKQKPQKNLWYINAPDLSYGNFHLLPGLGFAMLNKKHWGVAIELKNGIRRAVNLPKDFEPGNFFNHNNKPTEATTLVLLSIVREIGLKSSKMIPTIQAGLSYSERVYPDNFVYLPVTGGWFDWSDNYNYDMKKSKAMGLYAKTGCKYLFSKNIAVSAALWTVLQRHSYYGVEVGFQFGRLR